MGVGLNVVDAIRENAAADGTRPALISDMGEGVSKVVSYEALVTRMDTHANALRQGGLEVGDRCGLRAPQGAGFIELALGILAAQGCLAPIPDDHRGQVLSEFLRSAYLQHLVEPEGAALALSHVEAPSRLPAESEAACRALRSITGLHMSGDSVHWKRWYENELFW